tara:strand:- start:119 stop:478 length:360 start_codon:yes stop_codon:yes gene_type:complete
VSITKVVKVIVVALPDASVIVTVTPEYEPSSKFEKVNELLPIAAVAEVEKDNELVKVPTSLVVRVILGVALLFGVDIPEASVKEGGAESNNQVNSVAALLAFPAASVNTPALIFIDVAP